MNILYCDKCGTSADVKSTDWFIAKPDLTSRDSYYGHQYSPFLHFDLCPHCEGSILNTIKTAFPFMKVPLK